MKRSIVLLFAVVLGAIDIARANDNVDVKAPPPEAARGSPSTPAHTPGEEIKEDELQAEDFGPASMALISTSSKPDRHRVDLSTSDLVRQWCKHFGSSQADIEEAIAKVGDIAKGGSLVSLGVVSFDTINCSEKPPAASAASTTRTFVS